MNGYFAYQENVFVAMVREDYKNVRNVVVAKVLALRKQEAEESARKDNDDCPPALNNSLIR